MSQRPAQRGGVPDDLLAVPWLSAIIETIFQ